MSRKRERPQGWLTELLRGPEDWRRRSARLYPLAANAVVTRPDGAAGKFGWEIVYFPAIARNSPAAVLLGVGLPTVCAAAGLALPLAEDLLPTLGMVVLMLITGFGMTLAVSLSCTFLLGRPYWQPGAVSMTLLGLLTGIPLALGAQAINGREEHPAVVEHLLEWLTVQGLFMGLGCCVAALLWLPAAWWIYRSRGIERIKQ